MRRTPYTAIGIRRLRCFRCGARAGQQWNVCAMPGFWVVCRACDLALNETVLRFMGVKGVRQIMREYDKRLSP